MTTTTETKKTKQKNRKSRILIGFLILILLLVIGSGLFQYFSQAKQASQLETSLTEISNKTEVVEQGKLAESLPSISGTVRSKQSISLYWKISGTVAKVLVNPGDQVKQGDILAELDPATIDTSVLQAAVTRQTAETNLERLYTSSLNLATAYNTMITAQKAVKDAEDALNALGIVRKESTEIGVYYQDYLNSRADYESALEEYNVLKVRPLDDVDRQMAAQMLSGARTGMESSLSKYNWYNGEVDSLKKQQAEANLLLAKAQYDDAVRAYEKIKNGPTEAQVNSLTAQGKAAQATMNTAYIIAPVAGTIAEVAAKQFDVITLDAATTEVLAIRMEDLSAYEIDVAVSEMDINSISLGQTAEMTFDAVPLHMFTGKIVRISNVGLTTGTKVTYDMTILMDQTDALVRPGMMADIVVNTREVPDALYVSDKVVKTAEDGSRYVERLSADGTFEKIPVTVGIVSGTKTQILSDQIKAGDTVKAALQTSISIGGAGSGEVPELFVGRPGGGPRR